MMKPRILTICSGQSNMSISMQTELCRRLQKHGPVHASYAGGQLMETWVAGAGPYTRGTNYTIMIQNALGIKPDRVVLYWFQGESDTNDATASSTYRAKLEALEGFLKVDFATTDVRICAAKIWPQSDLLPLSANYQTIRNGLVAWAAALPLKRVAVETSDLYRPTGNVHLSEWDASGPGSSFKYVDRALGYTYNKFYR